MILKPLPGRGNEYLFTRDDSPVIWLSRYKKGFGRKQESLRTEDPKEGRQKRDDIFASWLGEGPVISKKVKLLNADLLPVWEKTKSRKSAATKDSIKYSLKHLAPAIDGLYPDQINETWWENTYIPTKRAESPDRKFFNELKWLMTYLNFLHRDGIIERLPRLISPDKKPAEGIYLDDSEFVALYEFAGEELKLQIDLGLKHFMRRSEVLLLPFSEINFTSGVIELPAERTKVRKARTVPLNPETIDLLAALKEADASPFVFPSPVNSSKPIGRTGNDTAWKSMIQRANKKERRLNPETTFHDLRHTGLTRAFAATNRYAEICVVAGLSLEEAQKTYLHLKPEHTRFVAGLVALNGGSK